MDLFLQISVMYKQISLQYEIVFKFFIYSSSVFQISWKLYIFIDFSIYFYPYFKLANFMNDKISTGSDKDSLILNRFLITHLPVNSHQKHSSQEYNEFCFRHNLYSYWFKISFKISFISYFFLFFWTHLIFIKNILFQISMHFFAAFTLSRRTLKFFIFSKVQQIKYKYCIVNLILIQKMKQTLFATLLGLAYSQSSLRTSADNCVSGCPDKRKTSVRTTGYSQSSSTTGASGLSTFLPVNLVGGGDGQLNGVSDLVVTSVGGGMGASSGGARLASGTGTNSVLITSATTGQSNIVSGKVITNGNYPTANLNIIQGGNRNINSNIVAGNVINNARFNTGGQIVDLDGVFNRLPTMNDVDNLILSSDSVGILKTIQTVATDNGLTCDQRIAYLLQLLGRVKAAVEKKVFAASQLKIIVDSASVQITRLQKLIDTNNGLIDGLNIGPLKTKLDAFVRDLQGAYADYNKIESQIPVLEAQVVGSQKEIDVLIKNSDAQRNRIQNDKIRLNAILAQIASLQAKIKDLQDKQAVIQVGINKSEKVIVDNDKAIAALRVKIAGFQDQIRNLTDQADTLSARVRDLEVKASRVRTDISVADTKKAKLLKDNADLEDRISIERKKNVPVQLTRLNDMIDSLRKLVPSVQAEIDRHYYYCFGDGKVEVKNTGGVVVYVVRGEAFGNYLRNLYGRNVVVPAVNGNVLFNGVDIFGTDWTGAFGYPFGSGAFEGAQDSLSLAGSFNCLNPGSLMQGAGTIVNIGSNWIDADCGDDGVRRFSLGSCSRLESTQRLPVVGQKFYWSGVPGSSGYNLYAGSCFN